MGKGTRKSSAQDVLFYELSRCARDANAAQALLAFDAATATVSGAFEARIYHKLLALLVDRPSDSARVRQHMDERGVTRDETMVPASTLLPAEFRMVNMPPSPQVTLEVRGLVHAGDVAGAVNCLLEATRAEPKPDLKLRTFAPIFSAVCDKDDAATAWQLQVWAAHAVWERTPSLSLSDAARERAQESMAAVGVRQGEEEMVKLAALCARVGAASPLS